MIQTKTCRNFDVQKKNEPSTDKQTMTEEKPISELIDKVGQQPVNLVPQTDVDPDASNREQVQQALARERHLRGFPIVGAEHEGEAERRKREAQRKKQLAEKSK